MSSQVRECPRAVGTYLTHFGESEIKRPLRVREAQKKKYRVGHIEMRSISLLAPFGNKVIFQTYTAQICDPNMAVLIKEGKGRLKSVFTMSRLSTHSIYYMCA